MSNGRDEIGRFTPGNPGGPGRPRRTVEHDYLAVLGESVTLEDWEAITERAIADAKKGDARARDWLTRHVLGNEPPRLLDVAASEERGETSEAEILALAGKQARDAEWAALTNKLLGDLTTR